MQINPLLRSLIGDLKLSDPKAVELKVGQIVRGVLLQMLSEQEGLLQIEGASVRARLETPMAKGQSAWLQVQNPSPNGDILLKPVPNPGGGLSEFPLKEWAKELGLRNADTLAIAAKQLQTQGLPVTKEQLRSLLPAIQSAPAASQAASEWLESAVTALRKEIPLSRENINFIRQALFGKPIHDQLQQLATALRASTPQAGGSSPLQGILEQLGARLQQVLTNAGQTSGPLANPPAPSQAPAVLQAQPAPQAPSMPASTPPNTPPADPSVMPNAQVRMPNGQSSAQPTTSVPGPLTPQQNGQAAALQPSTPPGTVGEAATAARPDVGSQAEWQAASGRETPMPQAAASSTGRESAAPASPVKGDWIPQLMKALGLDYEQQLTQLLGRRDEGPDSPLPSARQPLPDLSSRLQELVEPLKSLLLQASKSEDLPQSLKEPIQQLLQTITGQQLVNVQDRGSMFSQFTLFVPFHNGEGQQTATIHIQSRKHNKQLDSGNCRLLFDLEMGLIGRTVLDVQVVDRMVNLHLHNGEEWVLELIQSAKPELQQALQDNGYRLIAMKCSVFDGPRFQEVRESSLKMTQELRYKGVDIRV